MVDQEQIGKVVTVERKDKGQKGTDIYLFYFYIDTNIDINISITCS